MVDIVYATLACLMSFALGGMLACVVIAWGASLQLHRLDPEKYPKESLGDVVFRLCIETQDEIRRRHD